MSFYRYIITRKLYFAGKELYENPEKSICEIALDYGYSEQSALNRAMKNYFNFTPNELRKGLIKIPDDKLRFANFCESKQRTDNRLKNTLERLDEVGMLTGQSEEYLEAFERASKEYGFDADTCYAISEVAERLEIPVETFIESCFDLMADIHSSPDYLSPEVEAAIDCGISSEAELREICEYFDCKYYDLDSFMVNAYRTQKQN